jgi:serine/threonine protein kinase
MLVNPPSPDGGIWIRSQHRVGRRSRENMIWPQVSLAQLAALLVPDYTVEVVDWGEDAELHYLVLEFLHGEPMSDLLDREGPISADNAAAMLLPIMEALCLAHERGIVHRDIKPENIFLARDNDTGNEVAKLLDFGIAKLDDGSRATATAEFFS